MPSLVTVCEDSSPFLLYRGVWDLGTSQFDPFADRYTEGSFTVTQTAGATFAFSFYGTAAGVYGAKRGNHGMYQMKVDGQLYQPQNGNADPAEFNATLFSSTFPEGQHTIELRNMDELFTDIDYVTWETKIGRDDEPLIVNTIQASHPEFDFQPADAWWTDLPLSSSRTGGRTSNTIGATARLQFTGDAIALYGPSGPSLTSSYTVQVDGRPSQAFNATKKRHRPKQLLYYVANLGPGTHELLITLTAINPPGEFLSIDYVETYTTPSLGGSFPSIDGGRASKSLDSSSRTGLIIGVSILSALCFLLLLSILVVIFLLKKGKLYKRLGEKGHERNSSNATSGTSVSPPQFRASQMVQGQPYGAGVDTLTYGTYGAQTQYQTLDTDRRSDFSGRKALGEEPQAYAFQR